MREEGRRRESQAKEKKKPNQSALLSLSLFLRTVLSTFNPCCAQTNTHRIFSPTRDEGTLDTSEDVR